MFGAAVVADAGQCHVTDTRVYCVSVGWRWGDRLAEAGGGETDAVEWCWETVCWER